MIGLGLADCAGLEGLRAGLAGSRDEGRRHVVRAQALFVQRDYGASLKELEQVLPGSESGRPAAEATFLAGLIYADPLNPRRDKARAIDALGRTMEEYPGSFYAEQARVWRDVLTEDGQLGHALDEARQENQRISRISGETAREIQRLKRVAGEASQEIQRLRRIVEESKVVDMEIESKKRSQAQ